MFRMHRLLFALSLMITPALTPANAGLLHTWVASTGSDAANCDRPTPCATFNGAYVNTATGGEITCVDAGDFISSSAGLIISHSLTINCENSGGTASSSNVNLGIQVTTAAADTVILKGLDLDGMGETGAGGTCGLITFSGAGTLHLQNVKVNHIFGHCAGVLFQPNAASTLDVSNSDITDVGSSGTDSGIHILPASGVHANVTITRTQVQGNFFGVLGDGRSGGIIRGTISDSVVSGNSENGITAISSGAGAASFVVDQTKVSGNAYGLAAGGANAVIAVRNTTVFNNTTGLITNNGGALYTYGNNSVNGNTTNGAFTGTAALQ